MIKNHEFFKTIYFSLVAESSLLRAMKYSNYALSIMNSLKIFGL